MIFILIIAIQIPQIARQNVKVGILNVYKSMAALLIKLFLEPLTSQLPLLVLATVVFVTGIAIAVPALLSLVATLDSDTKGAAIAFYTFVLFTGASFVPLVVELTRSIVFTGLCIGLISILLAGAASVKFSVKDSQASFGN
jgi:MFS transporter, YNFM family, putative membrane transport protein